MNRQHSLSNDQWCNLELLDYLKYFFEVLFTEVRFFIVLENAEVSVLVRSKVLLLHRFDYLAEDLSEPIKFFPLFLDKSL